MVIVFENLVSEILRGSNNNGETEGGNTEHHEENCRGNEQFWPRALSIEPDPAVKGQYKLPEEPAGDTDKALNKTPGEYPDNVIPESVIELLTL